MAISEQRALRMDQKANQICAVLLPLLEAAGMGYATYVLVHQVCINYLMQSPNENSLPTRAATGIALIVVYCLLMFAFCVAFLRLLQVIWTDPGLVPLADKAAQEKGMEGVSTRYFDRLDAYICDYNGAPLWCEKCRNWKPDRAHHSSQLGRCVRRMDHYCPYAGGIISETNHKFFVQFLFYGMLYTGFLMIVMAVFLAERIKKIDSAPATWAVALGLGALFFLFTLGMFMTTFYNMAINYTTIEVIQKGCTYSIAMQGKLPNIPPANASQSTLLCEVQRSPSRSYIVVQTQPGENPWDRGVWSNVKDIMGYTVWDWLIPLRRSPCTVHNDPRGEFAWGPVVKNMMQEYNAGSAYGRSARSSRSRRRRMSRTESSRDARCKKSQQGRDWEVPQDVVASPQGSAQRASPKHDFLQTLRQSWIIRNLIRHDC